MREIKFRAWDVIRKTFDTCVSVSPGGEAYNHYDGTLYGSEKFLISQFTGLKDKNGKEIYEGDIVEYAVQDDGGGWDVCRGSVEFTDCAFQVKIVDGCDFNGSYEFLCDWDKCEVIGNIYENQELLEG